MLLIAYDLNKPGQDYSKLINALTSWGAKSVEYSAWVLKGNYDAVKVRDALLPFIDVNDRLLVTAMGDYAWYNLKVDPKLI